MIKESKTTPCKDDKHEWIDPNKNLLECKKCGSNGLSESAWKAVLAENKKNAK